MSILSSLEQETLDFTFFEKEFLRTLLASPSVLSIKQIRDRTGLSRGGVYKIYGNLNKRGYVTKKMVQKGTKKGRRSIAIFRLTSKGKEVILDLYPSSKLSYAIDLGSKGEISLYFDASTLSSEDKYRYEAYWLTKPPLITPFIRAIDFDRLARRRGKERPVEVNVSLRIKIPSKGVSRDIIDAANYFTFLEEELRVKQGCFWRENINWLETSVANGQGVWNTPYKDVGELCDLLIRSSSSIFLAMMLGLTSARELDEICQHVSLSGNIYRLKFDPLNIFEFLLTIIRRMKKGEELTFSDDHVGMHIFSKLWRKPEVKEWIKRCLKRDGRSWLSQIPFENLGFKRNKEERPSNSWIFDTKFPISLGVFYSMEKEKWHHIGAVMNILLDTIMLNKLPSRLGDRLDYLNYTDDVILEAWGRVKGFWQEAKNNRNLKSQISRLHKKELGQQFFKTQKELRDACCEFLEKVNQRWGKQKKVRGTRELSIYLPGKVGLLRPLELNPVQSRYKRIIKTIKDNIQAVSPDKKLLRILGSRRKKQKFIAEKEYDPDEEFTDYLEKLDYDDLMTKLAELSELCVKTVKKAK